MKITGENPLIKLGAYSKNVQDKNKLDASKKQESQGVLKDDEVTLSPRAKEIQSTKKLLDSVADIREEKVKEIKKQIENGTYQVDEKKIAAEMIKESLLNEQST